MILADFYQILMQRIQTKLPEIKHIDWWNHQPEREDDENPYQHPAVFIEFEEAEVMNLGRKKQAWILPFKLHYVTDNVSEVSSVAKPLVRQKGLQKMVQALDRLQYYIQGYNGTDIGTQFGSIQSMGAVVSHDYDIVVDQVMPFRVRLENKAAVHLQVPVRPKLNITVRGREL
jgi:hypothetical protein